MRIKKNKLLLLVILLLAAIVWLTAKLVEAETIMLQWDAVEGVDGYKIYQAIRGGDPPEHQFDYDTPVATLPQETTQTTIDLPGIDDADTKYVFTARSYIGEDTSEDSNVVSYVVSLVDPAAPTDIAGNYDDGIISISWNQPADEFAWRTISHWIVYYRIDGGDWIPIGRINSDHELTLSAPFNVVPAGARADVEFTIVSYRRSGVYSANSAVLTVDVDRRGNYVPPVPNLRITIEIPVM